ncbi:MAG: SDR family NAD(P)-dependent oxidoreductase [Pseudomonadota bacterium]
MDGGTRETLVGVTSGCVVTGYACRLPGANSATAFWDLLSDGRAAIGEVGPDRFSTQRYHSRDLQETGSGYTFSAGLLDDVWGFDPGFFGFSPREAKQMDPQQRLLLQVAWEALEHAGLRPSTLQKDRTGVYIGASASDYSTQFYGDPARIDAPFMLGNTLSILSNRISYAFDLTGPSYTVDTACSSSFYALDQARRALDAGEIDTAIVGAVNVLLSPMSFIGFARAGMLSPNGRCAFLDASADGYVRGEGAVVFVLRRAEVAEDGGDRIRGRLIATGINSDGRTNGLALPSAERQAALLKRLRRRAGITPDDISFVEAHGTGTRAGDLAEATSLGTVYGQGRETPLVIGSAKTNVGHLEPASGLVGLLKAQMALEHGMVPATLNISDLSPDIDLEALNLTPATAPVALADQDRPWIAAVNSFGFGGANAHALIEAYDGHAADLAAAPEAESGAPLILSSASADALTALASDWSSRLSGLDPEQGIALINQAAWRRERMAHTLVATGSTPSAIGEALARHAAGNAAPTVITGTRATTGRTAFVFSGNGSQWAGMGQHLFETDPVFRRAFSETSELFVTEGGHDLVALLADPGLGDKLDRATVGQPLLLALQVGVVQSFIVRGLEPDAVAGHSVGEVAAAYTAGALSLGDAVRLIQARASVLETLHGTGGMAAVLSGVDALEPVLEEFASAHADLGAITLAADNNPRSTTISGGADALDAFAKFARKRRLAVKRLDVPYPYHSAAVEPLREDLLTRILDIAPRDTRIDFVSSATGSEMPGKVLGPEFWWKNTRDPVLFRAAVETLAGSGCRVFVEIGPRPVLQNYVTESATAAGASVHFVPTLDKGRHQNTDTEVIVARAIAAGARHNEVRVFGDPVRYGGDLPAYPWQQSHFRAEMTGAAVDSYGVEADDHPILGWRERPGTAVWHNHLSTARQPWLADHVVGGATVFPAAGYVEAILAAGAAEFAQADGTSPALDLSGLDILQPLVIDGVHTLRTTVMRETGTVTIESSPYPSSKTWVLHARARIRVLPREIPSEAAEPRLSDGKTIEAEDLYAGAEKLGLTYGPAFRCFAGGRIDGATMMLELGAPEAGPTGCLLDPGCLDGAMHGLAALIASAAGDGEDLWCHSDGTLKQTFLPVRVGRLQLHRPGGVPKRGALVLHRFGTRSVKASLTLFGADDRPVATIDDLRLRAMPIAGRAPITPRFWRQVLEPRVGPTDQTGMPATWDDPAARLASLGVIVSAPPEGDAGALILDAACRRLAWDVVRDLTGPGGLLDAAALGKVDPGAYPLLGRMLVALEEDSLFLRDTDTDADAPGLIGTLAEQVDYPAFDELLSGLRYESPALSGDLLALAGLADQIPERLTSGLIERHVGHQRGAPSDAHWTTLETVVDDIAAAWVEGQRLTTLLVGAPPRDVLARLLDLPALTRLTLTDTDPGAVEVLARDLPRHPALEVASFEEVDAEGRARDLVILADQFCRLDRAAASTLSRSLAPGGLLIGTHRLPDLIGDLTDGQDARWWTGPDDAPVGRRAHGQGVMSLLAKAGITTPTAHYCAGGGQDSLLVVGGGRPSRVADATEAADPDAPPQIIFHVRHTGAERPAQALRRAIQLHGSADVQVSALSPLIGVPDGRWEGVVFLQPQEQADPSTETAERIGEIQALLSRLSSPERLWLILPGGCPGARQNAQSSPAMAALWGYGRTLMNEHPDLDIRLVDPGEAPPDGPACDAWAERLARVIAEPGAEREILTGPDGIAVPRIEPVRAMDRSTSRATGFGERTRRLTVSQSGGLDQLDWQDAPRRAPAKTEVEIAVRAAGLNFRDVMWAQGLLPEEALEHGFAGPALGMECAGVVVRAGEESGFAEGERVVAFASQALAGHVTTPATTVARIPAGLDFEAAASVPVVFATAHYALCELARIRPGERVLIHGGAGGVGLAALQIAVANGAKVFATAGTSAKRRLLKALGAEAVFDSRSLAFADDVKAASEGGVDVVLNALAGEAMELSIGCLRPFGRFVELGKRDFFADTKIGLYPFHRNLSYFGVDLDELLAARPGEARALLDAFSDHLASGTVQPPPYQVFQAGDVGQAFRLMQQAGHVGKIVVCPPRRRADAAAPSVVTTAIRGGWLVVGGTGGFGLATAASLATRGAEKLWLASRSGRPQEQDAGRIADLVASGVAVETIAMDVADAASVGEALARINSDSVTLKGVVHSAMVLRDRPARDLTSEDIDAVLAPKIAGAVNLDQATRGLGLDHFVLYSSAVTLIGNPGQAPYVAANLALERIAQARRAAGEPALAIGWGAVGDTGYLSREENARTMLDRMLDGAFLTSEEALSGLARWQDHNSGSDPQQAAVSFARMPWTRLAGDLPIMATPLYDRLDEPHHAIEATGDAEELRAELAALDSREALKRVTALLITEIAAVLHQPESEIDARRPLGEIGFDSLMAVELRLGLEEKIGLSLPLLSLADATTLTDVAVRILQTVRNGGDDEDPEAEDGTTVIDDLIAQHVSPTDADIEPEDKEALRTRARDITSLG